MFIDLSASLLNFLKHKYQGAGKLLLRYGPHKFGAIGVYLKYTSISTGYFQ